MSMSTLAKITGVIILIIGLVVVLFGVFAAVAGVVTASQAGPTSFLTPIMGIGYSAVVGVSIMFSGVLLAALGEGLYLLAQIESNGREANKLLVGRTD
jgi:hypothetical protein